MKDEKDVIDVDSKDAIDVDSADERVVRVEPPPGFGVGRERNWGAILAPGSRKAVASRLMHRGKQDGPHAMRQTDEPRAQAKDGAGDGGGDAGAARTRARGRARLWRRSAPLASARGARRGEADEEAERRAADRARELEARHRRAEETRVERISAVVRKAGEETRKVEEIAF